MLLPLYEPESNIQDRSVGHPHKQKNQNLLIHMHHRLLVLPQG
jgi:hypothetical protein